MSLPKTSNRFEPIFSEGWSGFYLSVLSPEVIEKTASQPAEMVRLKRQCEKQTAFVVNHPRFSACPVIDAGEGNGTFRFTMPFLHADSATQFIDTAAPAQLIEFAEHTIELIREFTGASVMTRIPLETVRAKSLDTLREIRCRSPFRSLAELGAFHLRQLDNHRDGFRIPVGKCHGDLTFSNVLFTRGRPHYVLIDFLDSYVESPLYDMAKLRQETKLSWSSINASRHHDVGKYAVAMGYLDKLFDEAFSRFPFFANYIDCFEFQNLLRVLKYVSDPRVGACLIARMKELMSRPSSILKVEIT